MLGRAQPRPPRTEQTMSRPPTSPPTRRRSAWLPPEDCRLYDLLAVLEQTTGPRTTRTPSRVEQGVLVYDSAAVRASWPTAEGRREVQAELARALSTALGSSCSPGAFDDQSVLDRATAAFNRLIADQRSRGTAAGDHFAKPGANDRVWNALEKLALSPTPRPSSPTTPTTSWRWPRPPGSAPATRSPRRSTSSTPAAQARPCTGTTTSASMSDEVAATTPRTCTRSPRC